MKPSVNGLLSSYQTLSFDQVVKGATPGVDGGQMGKGAMSFSYASSEENIREAARRLKEHLSQR